MIKIKLIIDIDEEEYKCLDYYQSLNQPVFKAIKNGIPLDDVLDKIRADITKIRDSWEKDNYHDEAKALTLALEIIDKHTGVIKC